MSHINGLTKHQTKVLTSLPYYIHYSNVSDRNACICCTQREKFTLMDLTCNFIRSHIGNFSLNVNGTKLAHSETKTEIASVTMK